MVKSVMANVIKMVKIKVKAAEHLLEFTLFTFFSCQTKQYLIWHEKKYS